MAPQRPASPISGDVLPARVQAELDAHIAHQRAALAEVGPAMSDLVDAVAALLSGGKRLRAAFLYWGYQGCGGQHPDAALRAATSMEVFQGAALLHDDVMDDSDLRRGRPTAHRTFATWHSSAQWAGNSERFGHAAAILAGDLCLTWSDELFTTSGLPADEMARARGVFDTMRTQLMGGQYLDVLESAKGWEGMSHEERLEQCRRVITYKSAKYSVEQPLLIGAHAAGAEAQTLQGLSGYGLELGVAFQLRDDVLGVFGDPQSTGKPAGDDIREGKRTVLIAHALQAADAGQTHTLLAALGDPGLSDERLTAVRQILVETGALARTEEMITAGALAAQEHLDATAGLTTHGRAELTDLIRIATARQT